MLTELRSGKTTRGIMIATLILIIPSFVFFYGWSAIAPYAERPTQEYGTVTVGTPSGERATVSLGSEEVEAARQTLAMGAAYRAMLANPAKQIDPNSVGQALERSMTDSYVVKNAARGQYFKAVANSLSLRVPLRAAGADVRQMFPTLPERDIAMNLERQTGQSLAQFLERHAGDMGAQALRDSMIEPPPASLVDLWEAYRAENETVDVEYANLNVFTRQANVNPTEEELKAYFDAHRAELPIPDRLMVAIVKRSRRDMQAEIAPTLTTDTLQTRYDMMKDQSFKNPRELFVRQIFIESGETMLIDEAMARAREIAVLLRTGESFESLANRYSDDVPEGTTGENLLLGISQGGRVPEPISRNNRNVDQQYLDKVLTLNAGDVSEPFLANYQGRAGAFIVKVESVNEESFRPFDQVIEQVRRGVASEQATGKLKELQDEWERAADRVTTLQDFADDLQLKLEGPLALDFADGKAGNLPGVGPMETFSPLLQLLKDDGGVGVVRVGDVLVAVEVRDIVKGKIPDTPEEDEATSRTLVSRVRRQGAAAVTLAEATSLAEGAQAAPDQFHQLALDRQSQRTEAAGQNLKSPADGVLRQIENFSTRALTATPSPFYVDKIYSDAQGEPGAYIVWRVTRRVEPTREEFLEKVDTYRAQYQGQMAQRLSEEIFADLEKDGVLSVKLNPDLR